MCTWWPITKQKKENGINTISELLSLNPPVATVKCGVSPSGINMQTLFPTFLSLIIDFAVFATVFTFEHSNSEYIIAFWNKWKN